MVVNNPKPKSWRKKLQDSKNLPRIVVLDEKQKKTYGEGTSVIPTPMEVDGIMRMVPKGKLITIKQICEALAKKHGTDHGDHMAATLFSNIAARAAVEAGEDGEKDITPYWRTVQEGGVLRDKYPGGVEGQRALLEKEGHTIVQKGKKLVVQDFETKLFHI